MGRWEISAAIMYTSQCIVLFIKMLNWRTGESTHRFDSINGDIYLTECAGDFPTHHADCFPGSQFIILSVLHGCALASSMLHHLCWCASADVAVREQWRVAFRRGLDAMGNRIIDSALAKVLMELYVIITVLAKRAPGMKAGGIYYYYYKLNWMPNMYGRRVEWAPAFVVVSK